MSVSEGLSLRATSPTGLSSESQRSAWTFRTRRVVEAGWACWRREARPLRIWAERAILIIDGISWTELVLATPFGQRCRLLSSRSLARQPSRTIL